MRELTPPAGRRRPGRRLLRLPKGSLTLAVFTGLSVALGYGREMVVAYYFGTTAAVDTFLTAFTLPKLLVALVTVVSVTALLPVYVAHLHRDEAAQAQHLMQRWFSLLLAVLAVLTLGMALAPYAVLSVLAPGFDAAQTAQGAQLLRGLLPYTILASAASVYKVVLDSHQRFTAPAASRTIVTVLVIASVVAVSARFGIWALVLGYGIGGAVAFAIHVASARNAPGRPRLRDLRWPRTEGLPLAGLGWVSAQMALGQVYSIADRFFASTLETGSIAALNYATAITTAPQNFVTAVLATALFPIMAKKVAAGRSKAALRETGKWLLVVWVCTAPVVALLIGFRTEIVALLLQRGAFNAVSTDLVASVLLVMPVLIAVGGSNTILNRLLLARRDYRFTVGLAATTGAAKIGLNAILVGPFGVVGIAMATVTTGILALVARLVFAWRYNPPDLPGAGDPPPAGAPPAPAPSFSDL